MGNTWMFNLPGQQNKSLSQRTVEPDHLWVHLTDRHITLLFQMGSKNWVQMSLENQSDYF